MIWMSKHTASITLRHVLMVTTQLMRLQPLHIVTKVADPTMRIPQVVDDVDSMSCDENGIPVEASLSHSLSAQDLSTQQHSGLLLSRHCEFVAANAVPKPRRLSGHSCSRTGSECWMLFDYCDKGCLLVSAGGLVSRCICAKCMSS